MRRIMSLLLVTGTSVLTLGAASAQDVSFPASAVIRGENIRLWADPSFAAAELEILERGDAITITGAAVSAEGDEFYPVEFAETGQVGWVRTVFVNPASIVPLQVLQPAESNENQNRQNRRNQVEDAPAENTAGGEQGGTSANAETREERRARRQAERAAAAEDAPNPVPVEQTPAELPAVDDGDTAPANGAEVVTFAGEGSGTTDPVSLEAGDYLVVISSEVSAPSDVVVRLLDADGQAQRLFRESVDAQSWVAEAEGTVDVAGDYTIRVSGLEDPWTITFEPLATE